MTTPIANGESNGGRDTAGRFAKGNPGGPGNPHAAAVARNRASLLQSVKEGDPAEVLAVLRDIALDPKAEARDRITAADKYLQRVSGPPVNPDVLERFSELEEQIAALTEQLDNRRYAA